MIYNHDINVEQSNSYWIHISFFFFFWFPGHYCHHYWYCSWQSCSPSSSDLSNFLAFRILSYYSSVQNDLVIFPVSGNNTFETSDFADRRFSFRNRDGGVLSPKMFLWKKILRNMKEKIIHFFFTKSFSFPEIANRRNFLGV